MDYLTIALLVVVIVLTAAIAFFAFRYRKRTYGKDGREGVTTDKGLKRRLFAFSRKQLCIPYGVFLALFVVFPLFLILYNAFTDRSGHISFDNFILFFSTPSTITNLFMSLLIAFVTTAVCILIAYPLAYILSRMKASRGYILVMLFVMPMWINFVLRAMALRELLDLFGWLGEYNFLNTIIGMVYDFLPFMILPLYSTLIKMDRSLEEAAADLGAGRTRTFVKVTLPLSVPGIISGAMMVFLPTMSCYVISETFGGGKIPLIGKLIEEQFLAADNWHYGSAIAIIMLIIMFITMLVTGGFKSENVRGGASL